MWLQSLYRIQRDCTKKEAALGKHYLTTTTPLWDPESTVAFELYVSLYLG